jgi:hypothetical protein
LDVRFTSWGTVQVLNAPGCCQILGFWLLDLLPNWRCFGYRSLSLSLERRLVYAEEAGGNAAPQAS